mmetsp:Transcript_1956/g.4352  ORF Transcript_1956/g.4352 Transcript_1956/m.4352 type:complete len:232 (+) Transcript_1956:37-732(+)
MAARARECPFLTTNAKVRIVGTRARGLLATTYHALARHAAEGEAAGASQYGHRSQRPTAPVLVACGVVGTRTRRGGQHFLRARKTVAVGPVRLVLWALLCLVVARPWSSPAAARAGLPKTLRRAAEVLQLRVHLTEVWPREPGAVVRAGPRLLQLLRPGLGPCVRLGGKARVDRFQLGVRVVVVPRAGCVQRGLCSTAVAGPQHLALGCPPRCSSCLELVVAWPNCITRLA